MDLFQGVLGLVVLVAVSLAVLLIGREIVCWYWKVNTALDQLARLESVLRNMDKNLVVLADQGARQGP